MKKPNDRREVAVLVRTTAQERAAFKYCADVLGLSLSGWIRMHLLDAVYEQKKADNQQPRR